MVSTIFKVGIIFLMVSSGAINTIGNSNLMQSSSSKTLHMYTKAQYTNSFFIHISKYLFWYEGDDILIQTMVMFFAEMLSLPVFFLQRYKNK